MKHKELVRQLKALGWYMKRQGGNHEIWTNGEEFQAVPRHREINEYTALAILRRARKGKR